MEALFLTLLHMSISAGYLVLAVIAVRALVRKMPGYLRCILWGLVGLRLILPNLLESRFSLVPQAKPLQQSFVYSPPPQMPAVSGTPVPAVPQVMSHAQIAGLVCTWVWVLGLIGMLAYALVSYLRVRRCVRSSIRVGANLHLCDHIGSAFILGILRPQICLPSYLDQTSIGHILAHESAHLKRGDHLWKPLGFALLAVYWFNPLMWLAYILLCRDIELACDEKVICNLTPEEKKSYSRALLNCSAPKRFITACPLAFGEAAVKSRIRSVLSYKKPTFWILVVTLAASIVLGVCFLTDPPGIGLDTLEPLKADEIRSISFDNERNQFGTYSSPDKIEWVVAQLNAIRFAEEDPDTGIYATLPPAAENVVYIRYDNETVVYYFTANCEKFLYSHNARDTVYRVLNPEKLQPLFLSLEDNFPEGFYAPSACVYMNPLSSYSAVNAENELLFEARQDAFFIHNFLYDTVATIETDWAWQTPAEAADDLAFLFEWNSETNGTPFGSETDLFGSKLIAYLKLSEQYHLLHLENGYYLVQGGTGKNALETVWSIYALQLRGFYYGISR